MKKLYLGLGLLAAVVLVAGSAVSLLAEDAGVADGLPDISGVWVGHAKAVFYPLSPEDHKGKDKVPLTLTIAQTGADLTIDLVVNTPEEPESFHMTGRIGNGNLWAITEDGEGILMMTGHVKSKGRKIKGIGIAGSDSEIDEIRFSLKR